MYIADALSRGYLKDSEPKTELQSELCHQVEELSLSEHLPISSDLLQELHNETDKDTSLQILMQVIFTGWRDDRKSVPLEVQSYFNCRDELSVQNGLVFKCDRVVIPTNLRSEIIKKLHCTHMGIEGSLRRACEAFYWPLMNAEIKDCITKCSICNTVRPEQCREPLMSHEVPDRPRAKVGTDLFTYNRQTYIVTVDYYSNFIEMEKLR